MHGIRDEEGFKKRNEKYKQIIDLKKSISDAKKDGKYDLVDMLRSDLEKLLHGRQNGN